MQNNIEIQLIPVIITFIASAAALILAGYFTLRRRLAQRAGRDAYDA